MNHEMACLTSDRPGARAARSESIRKTLLYMEDNFLEQISLGQLAGIANLSPDRYSTIFRREVGMPPYRYLSRLRIRFAQSLLRQGLPAAMVAAEAGFFDQSHLYRHFKRAYGVTPGQYVALTT